MQKISAKKITLSGWGNYPAVQCKTFRPEKEKDVAGIYSTDNSTRPLAAEIELCKRSTIIARGQGRSYGDAALNADGVILSERLNRFISFDRKNGIITVQAGVTLAEILDIAIPKGWILPVIPGTKYVSAGGAVACNIHGKNHFKEGDLARHIISLQLRLVNGDMINCSADNNGDIFRATAGGMGMTGFIEEVTLQLRKIDSLSLELETHKVGNLYDMIRVFEAAKDDSEYMIGWIDHFARGKKLGKGVFEKARHINMSEGGTALDKYIPPKRGITIPRCFPSFILNKYSMAMYNILRFAKFSEQPKTEIVDFDGFFHPLDRLKCWNRIYGKNGFFQYQFVIPEKNAAENLHRILQNIQERGLFSYLAVIKYHGCNEGIMSFPIKGYSLALDFPNTPQVQQLQRELNEIVCDMGGRIYLAKDALLTPELFERMYKDALPEWREILKQLDPNGRISSEMARRLRFRHE